MLFDFVFCLWNWVENSKHGKSLHTQFTLVTPHNMLCLEISLTKGHLPYSFIAANFPWNTAEVIAQKAHILHNHNQGTQDK